MNTDMPTPPPTTPPTPHHGLPRHAVTAFIALFLLIFIFGGVALFRGAANTPRPPAPTGVPTEPTRSFDPVQTGTKAPTVTPQPITRTRKYIYTIESAGPRKVGDLIIVQDDSRSTQLRMDDNGVIYYLEGGNVFSYSLATQEKQLLYRNADPDDTVLDGVVSPTGKLYVTVRQKPVDGVPQYYIIEDSLGTNKIRRIGPIAPVAYGGLDYLFSTDYGDILLSKGGDGCAAYGIIMKLRDARKDLIEVGEGCSEYPSLISVNPDTYTIYLARPKADSYPDTEYASLDSLNVVSEQTTQEFDITTIGSPVRNVLMDGQIAAFLTDSYAILYDTATKGTGTKVSIPKPLDYAWVLSSSTLYGSPYAGGTSIAVDMNTGATRSVALDDLKGSSYILKYLGVWKKRPVFYVETTE